MVKNYWFVIYWYVIWVIVVLVIDVFSIIENKYYFYIYIFFNCLNNCDKLECIIICK